MAKKSKNYYQNINKGAPPYDRMRDIYTKAQQLHQQGHLTEAEKLYRQVLAQMPDQPDTLHYLGLINMQKGNDKEAESLIKQSINLSINPMYCGNYGLFLATRNKHNEAIEQYKKALEIQPVYPECWFNLGVSFSSVGDFSAAEHAYKKALEYNKNYIKALYSLACVQEAQGKTEEATETINKIKSYTPNTADTYYKLAVILQKIGGSENIHKAREYFKKALETSPDSIEIIVSYATLLADGGRIEEATEIYRKILEKESEYNNVKLLYAKCLLRSDDLPEAKIILNEILSKSPDNLDALVELANLYRFCGDFEKALNIYTRILLEDPYNPEAVNGYINCIKITNEYDTFVQNLIDFPEYRKTTLYFYALGKVYNDLGQYDHAFKAYKEANDRQNSKIEYSINEHSEFIDTIINTFTPEVVNKMKESGSVSEIPVFILGTPRSGTSLVEQILSSHSRVYGAGELTYIEKLSHNGINANAVNMGYPGRILQIDADQIKLEAEIYLDRIQNNHDMREITHITDKMPGNYLFIGYIMMLFPRSRIIHCKRNPLDTCLSIYFLSMNTRHLYACDLKNLAYWYRDYLRLMDHWMNLFGERILTVHYEDLVNDTEKTARKLVDYIDLAWEDNCLDFHKTERDVITPSMWQVRQPIYKTSLERWKRYDKHIGVLKEILAGYY
jgi:tetratricopeptide (TPR) repeat protein